MRVLGILTALLCLACPLRADDWPQWLGAQRDGVWREAGILEKFPAGGPKVRWRTPVGQGYAGPAVADGKVFVTDYVLDEGQKSPGSGFSKRSRITGRERILCLDEKIGQLLWKHEYPVEYRVDYPAGPRATPVVAANRVYTLGTMGDLVCLDAVSGKVVWSRNFVKDYEVQVPVWGFAAHPLLDGDRLICLVGGEGSVAVAFHKDTGKEIWRALSASEPGYAPPMIYDVAGKRQLIIWHPEAINSLDPVTGKLNWSVPFKSNAGLSVPTPRLQGQRLFITSFYNGSILLDLDDKSGVRIVWKAKRGGQGQEQPNRTENLNSIMSTPILKGDFIYGVCSYGELRCLKTETGERVWMTLKATGNQEKPVERWGHAFLVSQGERTFLFNEKGDLIIANLTPRGYEEIDRAHILEPTNEMAGRLVVWMHPAFANKSIYVRNDKELVCISLAAGQN